MNVTLDYEDTTPSEVMAGLLARHGRLSVLAALILLLVRPKPKAVQRLPSYLSNHLLRDLGQPPEPDSHDYWKIRQ